jgi:AcrR family transcriptional regulator
MATSGARRSTGQSNARSGATRQGLVDAAIGALRDVGFAGASARAIANRADCTQSQVFYHFGSVVDLLLAALDEVSARRMKVYKPLLESATSPTELLQTARTVILSDLDSGDLKVLVEMVAGAQSVPGLAAQVAQRLAPWYAFAETAVNKVSAGWPLQSLLPVGDIAHAVVAGVLGLELLASLDADHTRATALLDHASGIAFLLSATPTPSRPT